MSLEGITLEELVAELDRLGHAKYDQEAKTLDEWAALWSCGKCKARRLLHEANRQGVLRTSKIIRTRIDGVPSPTVGYMITLPNSVSKMVKKTTKKTAKGSTRKVAVAAKKAPPTKKRSK